MPDALNRRAVLKVLLASVAAAGVTLPVGMPRRVDLFRPKSTALWSAGIREDTAEFLYTAWVRELPNGRVQISRAAP